MRLIVWLEAFNRRLERWIEIQARLAWRRLRRSPVGRNWWNATKAIILLASFVAFAIWLGHLTTRAVEQVASFPFHHLWWGLGIIGSTALVIWFLKGVAKYKGSWFKPAVVTSLIFVAIYGPITWFTLWPTGGKGDGPKSLFSGLPADIALPVIAGCESGNGTPGSGRQFDDRGYLIKNPTSSAIGKYQIMASLHEARALSLGYNIRTEVGNEGYARYLYAESTTQHWYVDPRSKACIEPKLLALAQGAPQQLVTKPAEASQDARLPRRTIVKVTSRRQYEDVASGAKYCWTTTRGPRHRYSDPIKIYNSVSPAEPVSFEGKRGKKLVCVW